MKKIEIKKYLNFLGMDGIEKMDFKSCEICENKNTKLIKSKIDLTAKLNRILEQMIKKNPYQWIWTHNRWK